MIRAIQRERWYLDVKPLAGLTFHLVCTAHHTRRSIKGHPTRIFMALSGLEQRLFPNNAGPLDLGQLTTRIRDHPVPAQQLHCFPSCILDDYAICPEVLRVVRRRFRFQVSRFDAYRDSSRGRRVRCLICHEDSLEQTGGRLRDFESREMPGSGTRAWLPGRDHLFV